MFSSLLSIVDSVLTLDEGCSRKDILSGDQVVIDGNLNKSVSGRICGAASLVCIHGADKSKKFYVIVGKHKLELQGSMDMNPKPLSMVCPTHKSVRVTNDNNKYFEIRFGDAVSFSVWLPALGEALAESMCSEVLIAQEASNRIVCSNMRRCIHTCELLTSPSKVYIRRVNEIYGIRRKLLEVMSTLRSNPCDVNMKDLRSLKELCLKYPELRADPDMKFLLERMPSDRYNSEDLQVILKDILNAESDDAGVVCAQVYHGASTDSNHHDPSAAVASAIMVNETYKPQSLVPMGTLVQHNTASGEASSSVSSQSSSNSGPTTMNETTKAAVPVHKKSRIVLNGVEIQSSARSPSSAGKALSKQIKIKSKFVSPSQRKEAARPKSKSKTPPQSMTILSEIKYNVASPAVLALFSSPAVEETQKRIAPVPSAPVDKENLPSVSRNITPAPRSSALKKPASVVKSAPVASLIPVRTKSPTPGVRVIAEENGNVAGGVAGEVVAGISCSSSVKTSVVPEYPPPALSAHKDLIASDPQLPLEHPLPEIIAIDLIPEVVEQRQSHFGSPVKSTTNVPFFSPPRDNSSLVPDIASLFDDAVVFAVSAQEPKLAVADKKPAQLSSPVVVVSQAKNGNKDSEKKNFLPLLKASLIPAYEVPVSKVMPLSTHLAAKPSRLPVAVERVAVSANAELAVSTEASAEQVVNEEHDSKAILSCVEFEVEVKVEEMSPVTPEMSPIAATPVSTRTQPTRVSEAQPSAVRGNRGKKSTTVESLMSPNAKPLRAKHFTPSRDAVGLSGTAPRTPAHAPALLPPSTPAQLKETAKSPAKTPLKAVPESPASVVQQENSSALEQPRVEEKRSDFGEETRSSRTNFWFATMAFCAMVCAIFASRAMLSGASIVAPVPLVHVPAVQIAAHETVPTPSLAASSELLAPPVPFAASESSAKAAIPTAVLEPSPTLVEASGFEMHVRFEGTTSTPQPASTPLSAQPSQVAPSAQSSSSQQPHALQRHSSRMLRGHLRNLQRLLSMPVKVLRSLFGKALQKFERIRKVLAE